MDTKTITIKGAREHNLKNINIKIPKEKFVVITGLSGSGKSSLAFDTLYAEGQRRYVESLSTYARQFLGQMDKPDVDSIEGLSPSIAIEQKSASHNPRSTVGTVTEIYDYLRLLFARAGTPFCYSCGRKIQAQSVDQITENIKNFPLSSKMIVLAPIAAGKKGTHEKIFESLKKEGFARVRINNEIFDLDELPKLSKNKKHTIDVVIDRLINKEGIEKRLTDAVELALKMSDGSVVINIDKEKDTLFSEKLACTYCKINYPELNPANFSFNSPQGACPECDGLGSTTELDPNLIVPDKKLSLRQGAIKPWANRNSFYYIDFLESICNYYNTDIYTPFEKLPEKCRNTLIYGSTDMIPFKYEFKGKKTVTKKIYEGIIENLKRRYLETDSGYARDEIRQYMNFRPCSSCGGTRLNIVSRSVKVQDKTLPEITDLSIKDAKQFLSEIKLKGKNKKIAEPILKEINDRLDFLTSVGLSYLTLSRTASTLSGGESQRIRLATQIGSKLSGVLYVLDEPSIGLHQRDNLKLIDTLKKMRDLGNTVLVVEHDEDTILYSDHVIDMGPGAGVNGGKVTFEGTPEEILQSDSITGLYLSGRKKIKVPEKRRKSKQSLILKGACKNNLKNVDVKFPLNKFICVTGVSGSGKSSLVIETLYKSLTNYFNSELIESPGEYKDIKGADNIKKIINIDQSPIGRTPRSNPGTYTGVFTFIRELFAKTSDAQEKGYKPGRFSFNVKGGRCEACSGDGVTKIEMHFLPDIHVKCDVCNGKRYNKETLDIKYKGKNIADVLDLTVNQGYKFFENIPAVKNKLQTLKDVGLGYIKIGQQATTLSGGEAQRIKLSRELSKKTGANTLYILDEPTTGLHMDDIKQLLDVLDKLVDAGNTVVVIEHNLDVIKFSDHIIDLGPEGGDEGGEIIGEGTPEQISENTKSYTGHFLKNILNR
ncbi:MAG: excinuclease ABC subunit UvrA [Thermodesulfobacteriota bacterium]